VYAVVVGERDLAAGLAQVRNLTTGDQEAVPLDALVAELHVRVLATVDA
jgi:histidyl-tRNA synthetase